jgi:hypothetical protein
VFVAFTIFDGMLKVQVLIDPFVELETQVEPTFKLIIELS